MPPESTDPPSCSGKGCRADALHVLLWNNPKIHPPERRKQWLACADHRGSLAAFLSARGFLRSVEPIEFLANVAPTTPESATDR